jgi:uncharacterized protein YjiS (DUF1127 family)
MYGYSQDPLRISSRSASAFSSILQSAYAGARDWLAKSWLAKGLAAIEADRAAKQAARELKGWDDHMLRDIGLERMHIDVAVRGVNTPQTWEPDCDPAKLHRLQNFH